MKKKSRKPGVPSVAPAEVELTIVIDKVLYDLLKAGEISQILTWKDISERPAVIAVSSPEDDETIVLRVTHMDTVGFGFLPKGYPARYQANRKTTRFHVVHIGSEHATTPPSGGPDEAAGPSEESGTNSTTE